MTLPEQPLVAADTRAAGPLRRLARLAAASRPVLRIVWPFGAVVVLLLLLANASVEILSAARAYAQGYGVAAPMPFTAAPPARAATVESIAAARARRAG